MQRDEVLDQPLKPFSISRLRAQQTLDERIALLVQAPLFSVLPKGELETLAAQFHDVRYRKGEIIFREGEPAARLFLIDEGQVKLTIASPGGNELLIALLGRGEIFGELSIIERGPRAMDATAMAATRVFALSADNFWTTLEEHPPLARRLLELMARRLRRADQTTQDLVFFDSPTRLARKLLQLAEEHGEMTGPDRKVRLAVKMTQVELAQMIGVTRGCANRLIASFTGRGWIDWNGGYPVLLCPEALMRRAR